MYTSRLPSRSVSLVGVCPISVFVLAVRTRCLFRTHRVTTPLYLPVTVQRVSDRIHVSGQTSVLCPEPLGGDKERGTHPFCVCGGTYIGPSPTTRSRLETSSSKFSPFSDKKRGVRVATPPGTPERVPFLRDEGPNTTLPFLNGFLLPQKRFVVKQDHSGPPPKEALDRTRVTGSGRLVLSVYRKREPGWKVDSVNECVSRLTELIGKPGVGRVRPSRVPSTSTGISRVLYDRSPWFRLPYPLG